jgi:uroporphyrin-3 C-methyltransferase
MQQHYDLLEKEKSAQKDLLDTIQKKVQAQQQQLSLLSNTNRNDWLLAEAEYLLRLANQRVIIDADVKNANVLLSAADNILKEIDDVNLLNVRRNIAEDRAKLNGLDSFDPEGVYLRIAAVADQVEKLTPFSMENENPVADKKQQKTVESKAVQSLWDKLSRYIVVRQHDIQAEPLLTPQQEQYLKQNLLFHLEQAQLALLRGKATAYQQGLSKAQEYLQRYYQHNSRSKALIQEIETLSLVPVAPEIPDISKSLDSLKKYNELLHATKPVRQLNQELSNPSEKKADQKSTEAVETIL